jgi:hypothetical protein
VNDSLAYSEAVATVCISPFWMDLYMEDGMKNLAVMAAILLLASCSHMGMRSSGESSLGTGSSGASSSGSSSMYGTNDYSNYSYGGVPYPDAYGVNNVLTGPPAGP